MSETSTRVGRRPAARTVIAVLALSALFMTGRVCGQGTSGTLPGPISSHELASWADQLELSEEQRRAIEPFHEEYREAFRRLRDGEIEQYLQELGGMMGRGFRGLDKEAIEDSLRKLDRLMTRISLLDDGLFDNTQSVLSDEQIAKLPRVMQARKRQRYRSGATRMGGSANRAARVDMSELYYGLELTSDQRQATDPLVAQYEDRLTAATEDLYKAATRIFLVVVEALEDQGVSFENFGQGGPPPADMMNAMRNAWTEASEKPREKAAAISDLNNQTLRRLTEFLPRDAAATLRDRYLGRAYPEVPRASQSEALKSFHAALRLPGLSPDLRADINAMAVQFRGSANQVVDEMIKAVDEYRNNAAPFGRDRTQRQEYNQKLEGYRERLASLDRSTVETLEGLLGPDLSQSVKIAAADTTFEDETSEPAGRDRRRGGSSVEEATDAFIAGLGPDPFLPSPITSRDVALYTRRLKLDDNDRFILKSLHEEYVNAFGQLKRTDIAALRAALAAARPPREEQRPEGARRGEEDSRPTGATPQQVDEIYDLRGSALKSIQALDGTFFDDIETLIAAPEQAALVQRLRTARERSVYNRGLEVNPFDALFGRRGGRHGRGGPPWPDLGAQSNESGVDLSSLVERLDLGAEERTKMDKLLADYEANALNGFRRQYESILKLRREVEMLRAQRAQPDGDGNRRERDRQAMQSRWESFRRLQENEGRKATDDRKFMVDLNRATLAVLTEALAENQAEMLDTAYKHAAFPSIYNDPDGADRYLTTALQLRDLGESQRDGIDAIIAEYRPAYEKLAEQIAEIHAARADEGNDFGRERWRTYQEQRNRIEVLDFERRELNAKALRQLREVLTDEQVQRLRLPSEVARNAGDGGRSG
jgi:Spy/CpxP family protein refolding chaperone